MCVCLVIGGHGGGGDGLEHLLKYSEIGCLCYCNGTLPGGRMNLFYTISGDTLGCIIFIYITQSVTDTNFHGTDNFFL